MWGGHITFSLHYPPPPNLHPSHLEPKTPNPHPSPGLKDEDEKPLPCTYCSGHQKWGQGLGQFRGLSLGFRVWGVEFRVEDLGLGGSSKRQGPCLHPTP